MLDKLVESKNNRAQSKKLKGLLFLTSTIAFCGVTFALIFSLFSQNLAMGNDNIDLSRLVAPSPIMDEEPPAPKENQPEKKSSVKNVKNNMPTRKENILRLDESPQKVPTQVSTKPSTSKARPTSNFKIGVIDSDPPQVGSSNVNNKTSGKIDGTGFNPNASKAEEEEKKPEIKKPIEKMPPPPKPKPIEKPKKDIVVSKGVINGKAKNLVTPAYPAVARAAGVSGTVSVQVLISEDGRVLSANVSSGHPLLRRNALAAARRSTFTPTILSNDPVKVRGVIVYNFN